jgi:hypothetical protein
MRARQRARTRVADDLGRQVLGRAAKRVGLPILHLLGKAKVDQLEVALGVDEDVLGLQVAVGDALALVQELEYQHNLGGVELRCGFVEAARPAQVAEYLAARAVVKHHVERVERLEAGDHSGDEGVAGDLGEHVALVAHMLDLLEADHVDLAQDLEREDLAVVAGLRVGEPHQPHARKGAWGTVSMRSRAVSRAAGHAHPCRAS